MHPVSYKICVLILLFLKLSVLKAQESVNTSGGDITGESGFVSYSIGQVVYTTNQATSGTVAQGVQHAYEIFIVGIGENPFDISIVLYPNPTSDILTLQIGNYNKEKLAYQLYDLHGRLLNSNQIVSQNTQINMEDYPATSYLVYVVSQENKNFKTFKIIKTN